MTQQKRRGASRLRVASQIARNKEIKFKSKESERSPFVEVSLRSWKSHYCQHQHRQGDDVGLGVASVAEAADRAHQVGHQRKHVEKSFCHNRTVLINVYSLNKF